MFIFLATRPVAHGHMSIMAAWGILAPRSGIKPAPTALDGDV